MLDKRINDTQTNIEGDIDEIRIWADVRTPTEIQVYINNTPPVTEDNRYLLISFWEGNGNISYDPYNPNNYASWDVEGALPAWTASCGTNIGYVSYKVGNGNLPPCAPPNLGAEHICNGNFEQYDSILNNPNVPFWAKEYHPFIQYGWQSTTGSDVVNWKRTKHSPDFFVRNGVGGIPISSIPNFSTAKTWNWPASGNNAIIGLYSMNYYCANSNFNNVNYQEGVITDLIYPLVQGGTYKLSFYAYTKNKKGVNVNYGQEITAVFTSSTNSSVSQSMPITLTNKNIVSNNSGLYPGWEKLTLTFTSTDVFDKLELHSQTILPLGCSNDNKIYSLIDDVSLVPVYPPGSWPQSIAVTNHHNQSNGGYERYQDVDSEDNVYVAGNEYHDDDTCGFFLRRYKPDGTIHWTIPVNFNSKKQVTALEVDDNGNTYLGIYSPFNNQAVIHKYDSLGVLTTSSSAPVADPINDMVLNPAQTELYVAHGNDIRISSINTVPVSGGAQQSNYLKIYCLAVDMQGNVFVAGLSSTGSAAPLRLEKLTSSLNSTGIFNNSITSPGGVIGSKTKMFLQDLKVDQLNNVYLAGAYNTKLHIGNDSIVALGGSSSIPIKGYLAKFKNNLNVLWIQNLDAGDTSAVVNSNQVNSIAISDSGHITISGTYANKIGIDGNVYTNGSFPNVSSQETYIASFTTQGVFRWFAQTQTPTGITHHYEANHCSVISYRASDDYIVTGNFEDTNRVELFDHGILSTGSDNNVFTCKAIDFGSYAYFKQNATTKENNSSLVKMYPNPNSGILHLDFSYEIKAKAYLNIYNLEGKNVLQNTLNNTINDIVISDLSPGLYLVNIILQDQVFTEKLYIQ